MRAVRDGTLRASVQAAGRNTFVHLCSSDITSSGVDRTAEHHHEDEAALIKASEYLALAWDKNARRFRVPRVAVGWRVLRKQDGGKGRPEPVFGLHGPVHIEIDAGFDALRAAVNDEPGWYVLHAVDQDGVLLADVPAAHVYVSADARNTNGSNDVQTAAIMQLASTVERVVSRASEREQALVDALVQMTSRTYAGIQQIQESTSGLIRAAQAGYDIASGVSLPRIPPPAELPAPPPPAAQPSQRNLLDLLCSPTGNTLLQAVTTALRNAQQ